MRLSSSRWFRFITVWLVICLLASGGITAPLPLHLQPLVASLADATLKGGITRVDQDLADIGFNKAKQESIHGWPGLSPVRKIETAYWAAEQHTAGSGEHALALLSRNLALGRYPTLQSDPDVKPFLDLDPGAVSFASLRKVNLAKPPDPKIMRVIIAMAREL